MNCKEVEERIVNWIIGKVTTSGAKGAVVGVSGGIDSAVVAVLTLKALGTVNTRFAILPCQSNPKDKEDAYKVIDYMGLSLHSVVEVDLSSTFHNLTNLWLSCLDDRDGGYVLASANLKARLRMCSLYYIANLKNYLVMGTGNKSEIEIGYFTKYGDGGVDLEPMGQLLKSEVVELARYLGLPEDLITKPPSAGLWEGQTDEKEMGFTYGQLDAYLTGFHDKSNLIGYEVLDEQVGHRIESMRQGAMHKHKTPPVCDLSDDRYER